MAAGRASRRVIQWRGSNLNGATYFIGNLLPMPTKGPTDAGVGANLGIAALHANGIELFSIEYLWKRLHGVRRH